MPSTPPAPQNGTQESRTSRGHGPTTWLKPGAAPPVQTGGGQVWHAAWRADLDLSALPPHRAKGSVVGDSGGGQQVLAAASSHRTPPRGPLHTTPLTGW